MAQRDVMIRSFSEDPEVTVFLMSLKAGGMLPHPPVHSLRRLIVFQIYFFSIKTIDSVLNAGASQIRVRVWIGMACIA